MSSGEERIYTLVSGRPAGWSSGHRVTEVCLEGYGVCRWRFPMLASKGWKDTQFSMHIRAKYRALIDPASTPLQILIASACIILSTALPKSLTARSTQNS